jgi:hypothetical protein
MIQAHSTRQPPPAHYISYMSSSSLYAPTPPPLQLTTYRTCRPGRQSPTSPDQNQLSPAAPYQRRGGLRKK